MIVYFISHSRSFVKLCIVLRQKNMTTKCHLHAIYGISYRGIYVHLLFHIYATKIKYLIRSTSHILSKLISCYWHIPLHTYGCHTATLAHTLFILYCHTDPTLVLHTCAKLQPTTASNSQHVDTHVSETYSPTKLQSYAMYLIWGMSMHTYATQEFTGINHVTRGTIHILLTLPIMFLAYIIEQLWLPYSAYTSHQPHIIWADGPQVAAHMYQNTTNHNKYFIYRHVCMGNKYGCQRCIDML